MPLRNLLSLLLAIFALAFLTCEISLANDQPTNKDGDEAQQDKPEDAADEPGEDAKDDSSGNSGLAERWLERMRNLGRRNPNEKSHDTIKTAFQEISAPASDCTALIFSGDKPKALGTVVSADGFILTKASELEDDISCRLKDGRHVNAEMVGVHEEHDLAMLKIKADDLTPIQWEAETQPVIGSWLVTSGIDDKALAIGVVSVAPRRIRQTPGVLGVSLDDGDGGAKITEVMRRSAAQKAGVKTDDIVLSVNGKRTKNREALVREIRKHAPGDEVKLQIKRGDEEVELAATLGSHFTSGPAARSNFQNSIGGSLSLRRAGFEQALQHDTVLEPHECGGPVLNLDGKAVGINIARAGRVSSYMLPANLIVAVLDDMKEGKFTAEEAEKRRRVSQLKREIEQMAASVEQKSSQMSDTQKRIKQSEDVLKAAQQSLKAAKDAAASARDAAKEAEDELEKLQAQLEELEAE